MTAVCSVGLDMIALPGDTPAEVPLAIIADEMAIGVVNQKKPTAVRSSPPMAKGGRRVNFGGLLGEAAVMAVHPGSPPALSHAAGHPAPLQRSEELMQEAEARTPVFAAYFDTSDFVDNTVEIVQNLSNFYIVWCGTRFMRRALRIPCAAL